MKDTIGFIGLGAMGEPMAANLLRGGVDGVSCANHNANLSNGSRPPVFARLRTQQRWAPRPTWS